MRKINFKKKNALSLNKRFTLIEVLVVVAIIGILVSLLMPSLSKSRQKAKAAVCKNQLKQIFTGMIMYSDDNSGVLPYVRQDTPNAHSRPWHWSVAHYLNVNREEGGTQRALYVDLKNQVFKCPSNESVWTYGYGSSFRFTGYMMPFWAGFGSKERNGEPIYQPVPIANVSSPDDAMLLGEGHSYYFNGGFPFTISAYHDSLYNRLFIDGHIGKGFQKQGFSTSNYWMRWAYYTGR